LPLVGTGPVKFAKPKQSKVFCLFFKKTASLYPAAAASAARR
jgi:hypothetical protein